jgi:Bacterial PH domain
MSDHEEYEFEEIPGLPEKLPAGESIVWRGSPRWQGLAWRAYHLREVTIYFSVLLLFQFGAKLWLGRGLGEAAGEMLWVLPLAALAVALICGLAWLSARTTIYTVTNRRIVMRIGIALPMTLNLPFESIGAVNLKSFSDGTGDLSISFIWKDRFAFLVLWPHARPWRVGRPEPTLRAIAGPEGVADVLGRVLTAHAGTGGAVRVNVAAPVQVSGHNPAHGMSAAT